MNKSPQLKPLSNPELSSFSSQLSLILRSGISALEGISIMLEDASSEEEPFSTHSQRIFRKQAH